MLNVIVQTIDKNLYKGAAIAVSLPGLHGKVGILPYHSEASFILTTGKIVIKTAVDSHQDIAVNGGVAHMHNNTLDVLLTP